MVIQLRNVGIEPVLRQKKIGADATGEVDVQILVHFWWVVGYWWIVADEQLLVRG